MATSSPKLEDAYKLGKVLGKGNYAEVRLAQDLRTKEDFAVKCVDKTKLTKEDLDGLTVEIAVLRELRDVSPHVIRLIADFETPRHRYMVLELMSGGELFDRIVKREHYSEADAQPVVLTLATVLNDMHKRDVVHRDLKPENILLKDQSEHSPVKLADFGFARHVGTTGCRTACGTPSYVAPEVIGGKVYGVSPDVWSLGVIVYILLCGYPPFYDANQQKLFKVIQAGKFNFDSPWWDNISPEAKDLVKRCLVVDPAKRATMEDVVKHPWVSGGKAKTINIGQNRNNLKVFNAKRKLKASLTAAIAANRLAEMLKDSRML